MGEWETIRVDLKVERGPAWEAALDEVASMGYSRGAWRKFTQDIFAEIERDTWEVIKTGNVAPAPEPAPPQKRTRGISLNGVI